MIKSYRDLHSSSWSIECVGGVVENPALSVLSARGRGVCVGVLVLYGRYSHDMSIPDTSSANSRLHRTWRIDRDTKS